MNEFPLQKDDELDDMGNYQESSRFRLILSFFVALFTATSGYPVGRGWKIYEYIYNKGSYYIDAFFNWVMIYFVMEYIYYITGVLDKATPWKMGWKLRMGLQAFVAILGTMFFMEFYSMLYFQMTGRVLLRIQNSVFQVPLSMTLSAIYALFCCIRSLHAVYIKERTINGEMEENRIGEAKSENPIITMRNGKPVFLLDLPIALIVYNEGINRIYPLDPDGEILDNNRSLSYLYAFLDQYEYRRGGRDYIINRQIIKEYKAQADGNILLHLNYPYGERLYVSKGQTEGFIQWLRA